MTRRMILAVVGLSLLLGAVGCQKPPPKEAADVEVFRAVHLINLKDDAGEAKLSEILDEFNKVIAELGYPDIGYRLWKERGDVEGKYKYIFESKWPNQKSYDMVHNAEEYKAIGEKYNAIADEMILEHVYSRYIPGK